MLLATHAPQQRLPQRWLNDLTVQKAGSQTPLPSANWTALEPTPLERQRLRVKSRQLPRKVTGKVRFGYQTKGKGFWVT